MPFNTLPNAPNFGAYVSPWVAVSNETHPGEPAFLELAQALVATEGITPLTEVFPEQTIPERRVVIEQRFEGTDTIFPLVEPGKPDVVLGNNKGIVRRMIVQPLYIRASAYFSPAKINYMLKPGTMNDRQDPNEYIREEMARMAREHNLTWDVYRAMMLLGGINYTDPRTGVSAQVSSRIPAHNLFSYNVTSGYRGRNEANFFRTLVDQHGVAEATAGVPWTHPDADIAHCVRRFARWFKETNKSTLTGMYVSADLLEVINMNTQIRLQNGGILPKWNTTTGDNGVGQFPIQVQRGVGFDSVTTNALTMGPTGVTAIAGIPIISVDTKYKDPVDGVWKRVWPKNKVVFVANVDPQGRAEAAGRTQYCISEEMDGAPGLWVRTQDSTQIPAAPGMYVQMGNAGLPYLKYPYRVAHLTVSTVDEINNRLGVLGDSDFGLF